MIKIEITGDTPREALVAVTAWGLYCMSVDDIREAAEQLMAEAAKKGNRAVPAAHAAAPNLVVAPPVPAAVPAPPAAAVIPFVPAPVIPAPVIPAAPIPQVPTAPAPSFTIEQVATAGAELVQAQKTPQLMALLAQFGVQAVTELKPDQMGAFATALRGMGARI